MMFLSVFWFVQAILILIILACLLGLVKLSLDVVRHNADEGVSIWFKARQMQENLKDRVFERDFKQDKATLALEAGRQELQIKASRFVIAGLDSEAGKERQ